MKSFGLAVVGALISASYWWLVATVGFGLVAGDPGPAAPPRSAAAQTGFTVVLIVMATLIYALGTLLWRRVEARLLAPPPPDR